MIAAFKSLLATVVGNTMLVVWTLLMSSLVVFAGGLGSRRLVDRALRLWARLVTLSSGVQVVNCDPRHLADLAPCIVMANHSSIYDIPALLVALPWSVRFLAKRELFRLPFLGWGLRAGGFVSVDRGHSHGGATAFAAARRALAAGTSLAIFPEETRSLDGQLLPFRGGGALLAKATDVPVVPVGIRGASAIRPRNSRVIRPGTISVHYGKPLMPADYEHRKQLNRAVREQIAALIGQDTEVAASEGADESRTH